MSNSTNLTCNYTLPTAEQKLFLEKFEWWMETMGHLVLGCFGILLNCITIFVLTRPNMWKSFFNRLLATLAVFDSLYLLCEVSEAFRHRHNTMVQQHLFVNFVYPVRNMLMCSSIYITVALAYERHQALKDPTTYRLRSMQNMGSRLLRYVSFILVFNVILYAPKFNDLKVEELTECTPKNITQAQAKEMYLIIQKELEEFIYNIRNNITTDDSSPLKNGQRLANEHCTTDYNLVATKQRFNYHYVFWYINVTNLIFTVVIPLILLVYLNYNVGVAYKQFKGRQPSNIVNNSQNSEGNMTRARRSNEINKTKILFLIVLLYVICHSLRVAMNINEFIAMTKRNIKDHEDYEEAWNNGCIGGPSWTRYGKIISQLLLIINATMNFFIYVLFDRDLKQVLRQLPVIQIPLKALSNIYNYIQSQTTDRTDTTNIEMSTMPQNVS